MDLDGDGYPDILSGSYSRMDRDMAGLFQVLYGQKDRTFRQAEVLKGSDGQPLILPGTREQQLTEKICTRPFAIDLDGDGHLDLVVGNFSGTFYWFRGQGKGKFSPKSERIRGGGSPLRIRGAHSDPFVIDWDGDGDLDLLSGSSEGGVQWAENRAGKGKVPEFSPFRALIQPGPQIQSGQFLRPGDLTGPGRATRIWVDDVNGDGKLDLLVGDTAHLVSPARGLSERDFKKKYADWEKNFATAQSRLNSARDDSARKKAREEVLRVYEQRTEFLHEERTGFVWLYLRK